MLDKKTIAAIDKYCNHRRFGRGLKDNITKTKVMNIVNLLMKGQSPKLVAVTLGMNLNTINGIKRNLSITHRVKFPLITQKIYTRHEETYIRKQERKQEKDREESEKIKDFLSKKTNKADKKFAETVDLDLIESILKGTLEQSQVVRIKRIEKHLKVSSETAIEIYHRYKKERIWW